MTSKPATNVTDIGVNSISSTEENTPEIGYTKFRRKLWCEVWEKHLAEGKRLDKKFKFSEVLQSYNDSLNKEEERIKKKLITKKSKNVL